MLGAIRLNDGGSYRRFLPGGGPLSNANAEANAEDTSWRNPGVRLVFTSGGSSCSSSPSTARPRVLQQCRLLDSTRSDRYMRTCSTSTRRWRTFYTSSKPPSSPPVSDDERGKS
ncbi:unnamed protein product [Amoebophrya sp. A25]|nr:unnamed protein product [Amoebophrya sp. A25]|eukprot:GSA25T00005971001.1